MEAVLGAWHSKHLRVPAPVVAAALVSAVVLVLALLSSWTGSDRGRHAPRTAGALRRLVRKAKQWGDSAEQSTEPLMRLMQVNYALAYLRAAKAIATEADLLRVSGHKVTDLLAALEEQQTAAVAAIVSKCPAAQPRGRYAGFAS